MAKNVYTLWLVINDVKVFIYLIGWNANQRKGYNSIFKKRWTPSTDLLLIFYRGFWRFFFFIMLSFLDNFFFAYVAEIRFEFVFRNCWKFSTYMYFYHLHRLYFPAYFEELRRLNLQRWHNCLKFKLNLS